LSCVSTVGAIHCLIPSVGLWRFGCSCPAIFNKEKDFFTPKDGKELLETRNLLEIVRETCARSVLCGHSLQISYIRLASLRQKRQVFFSMTRRTFELASAWGYSTQRLLRAGCRTYMRCDDFGKVFVVLPRNASRYSNSQIEQASFHRPNRSC